MKLRSREDMKLSLMLILFPSAVYSYRITEGSFSDVKKFVVMK